MTLDAIRAQVMFQTNNDREDLPDFEPHLLDYINEGYDLLVLNFTGEHVRTDSDDYPPLGVEHIGADGEPYVPITPNLPEYAHRALADYATYMVYRNGNAVKQNRGMAFYSAFLQVASQLKFERGGVTKRQFINIFTR